MAAKRPTISPDSQGTLPSIPNSTATRLAAQPKALAAAAMRIAMMNGNISFLFSCVDAYVTPDGRRNNSALDGRVFSTA